jgi:hypothetical protein
MRLYEEYFKRHSIADVPVARHCSAGSLILRTTDPSIWKSRWVLVSMRWENHDHHPGQYQIGINYPIHDGYASDQLFTQSPSITKKWHEYEDFFLDWSSNLTAAVPVIGSHEVVLAAWEMFVFSYDSWFTRQPFEIKRSLFEGLDKDNPIHHRYQHYQDVAVFLSTHHPAVLRAWKYEVLARVQNYSDWLAAIVDKKCKLEEKNIRPFKLEIP